MRFISVSLCEAGNSNPKRSIRRRQRGAPSIGVCAGQWELLERRVLLAVNFVAGPLTTPSNRTDIPLGMVNGTTEVSLAIDPTDPGVLAIANQGAMLTTTDAGGSFSGTLGFTSNFLSGTTFPSGNGDPDLIFDSTGRLFYTDLASGTNQGRTVAWGEVDPATNTAISANATFVPQFFGLNSTYDKQFAAGDTNPLGLSPYADNLYAAFAELNAPSGTARVMFSRSTNGNASWSFPIQLNNTATDLFAWPPDVSVDPRDGDVYVAYPSDSFTETGGTIMVRRSTDGGVTFDPAVAAFPAGGAAISSNSQTWVSDGMGGFVPPTDVYPNARFWTIGSRQPWVLPDPARPGNVYVITCDDPNNDFSSGDGSNLVIARSTDNGQHWTQSSISTNSALQVFPTAAIDEFGNIAVAWYDTRANNINGNGDLLLDVRATYSTDGGQTWAPSFLVSDPSNPLTPVTAGTAIRSNGQDLDGDGDMPPNIDGDETYRIGEYFHIDLFGGTAYVSWNGNTFSGSTPTNHQAMFGAFGIRGALSVVGDSGAGNNIEMRTMSGNSDFFEVTVNGQRQYAGLKSASSSIAFSLGAGNDTLQIHNTPGDIPINIVGGNGNDTIIIGDGDLDNVNGTYVITGDAGTDDELFLFDNNDTGNDDYSIVGGTFDKTNFDSLSFSTLEQVNVVANNSDNTVNVFDLANGTNLLMNAGSGDDQINIGNGDLDSEILGAVTVVASSGNDFVRLFDQSDVGNDSYTITSTTVTKPGTAFDGLTYDTSTENVVLTASDANNTINIDGTSSQLVQLTVNARAGTDTINVGNGNVAVNVHGNLSLNGGDGNDTMNVDDEFDLGNDAYIITGTGFTKTGFGILAFAEFELFTLIANLDDNAIALTNTLATTDVSIDGGQANDSIGLGNGDFDSNILSDVTIAGGQGNDTLTIGDATDDSGNDSYFLESTTFSKFNFVGTFTYNTTENVVLNANDFDNNVLINSTAAGVDVTVNGDAGDDDVFIGNGDIDSNIHGDVFVHGMFGDDRLFLEDNLDNVGADTYTITDSTFTKTAYTGQVSYQFMQGLILDCNDFDNTININGTNADTAVTVNGNDGADTFRVTAPPMNSITINGNAPGTSPGDGLVLIGTPTSVGTYQPSGTTTGSGLATYDGQPINFTGIERPAGAVTADTFDSFTFITPNSADQLTVNGSTPDGTNTISGVSNTTTLTELTFTNVANFILNTGMNDAGSPDDIISVEADGIVASGLVEFRLIGGTGHDTLNVNAGTFSFLRDAFPDTSNLTINVGSLAVVRFDHTQHIEALNIASKGRGILLAGSDRVLVTGALSIAGSGLLDLTQHAMIVRTIPLATLRGYLVSGYAGGAWTGTGLTSSTAAAVAASLNVHKTALGYGDASALGLASFMGEPLNPTDELVRYTYSGDATLNTLVNALDFNAVATNFGGSNKQWFQGDFNYDGRVNTLDFSALALNFNLALPAPALSAIPSTSERRTDETQMTARVSPQTAFSVSPIRPVFSHHRRVEVESLLSDVL